MPQFLKGLLVLVLSAARVAAADTTNSPQVLPDSVRITPGWITELASSMRLSHPALNAAEARVRAAKADAAAVPIWEDPMVRLGGMVGATMMRAEDGDLLYGVEQRLPLFGRPQATRRVAVAGAAVEDASLEFRFQQLRSELAIAVFRAALASETVVISAEDLDWLSAISKDAESLYSSGRASLSDVLRIQNEVSLRRAELANDKDRSRQAEVVLSRFLAKPIAHPWPRLILPEPGPEIRVTSKLLEIARKHEPQTHVMRRQIEQASRSVELANKERLPQFNAGVEGRNYSRDGEFRQGMVFITMSVPWLNGARYDKGVQRERQKVRGLEFDLVDYERGLGEEVQNLSVMSNAALRRAKAYRDEVLPRSKSALDSTRAAWEAGRATFTNLLDARRELLKARLQYASAVAEQYEALSELVLCCGLGDLEALQKLQEITSP